MDLETENRIAAILLREAAELRRQAEKDGVRAYLEKRPDARFRPNSRFLTATVLGVQQSNRAVEVNELWRVRQKERELEDRIRRKSNKDNSSTSCRHIGESSRGASNESAGSHGISADMLPSSERVSENHHTEEDRSLRDEELEDFLLSKVKRGRGSVGPRMDETGPYLAPGSDHKSSRELWLRGEREDRVVLGPQKPSLLKHEHTSDEESHQVTSDEESQRVTSDEESQRVKRKKAKGSSGSSKKKHSAKHRKSKETSEKKRRRKDKGYRHSK